MSMDVAGRGIVRNTAPYLCKNTNIILLAKVAIRINGQWRGFVFGLFVSMKWRDYTGET